MLLSSFAVWVFLVSVALWGAATCLLALAGRRFASRHLQLLAGLSFVLAALSIAVQANAENLGAVAPQVSNLQWSAAAHSLVALLAAAWMAYTLRLTSTAMDHHITAVLDVQQSSIAEQDVLAMQRVIDNDALRWQAQSALERIDVFRAALRNEFLPPLAFIASMCKMLSHIARDEHQARDLATMQRLADQLLGSVEDGRRYLKGLDSRSRFDCAPVAIKSLERDVLAVAGWLAQEQKFQFTFLTLGRIPAYLVFDEQRVRQVLTNMLANAAMFSQRGFILLTLAYEVSGQTQSLVWTVVDTGRVLGQSERASGMARSNRLRQGLEKGLANVRRLVTEMGAQVQLLPEPEDGATMQFYVPVQSQAPEETARDAELVAAQEDGDPEYSPNLMGALSGPHAERKAMSLPMRDLVTLNLGQLRSYLNLGQVSEMERWLKRSRANEHLLSPVSRQLVEALNSYHENLDLQGMQSLLDQVDSPVSRF